MGKLEHSGGAFLWGNESIMYKSLATGHVSRKIKRPSHVLSSYSHDLSVVMTTRESKLTLKYTVDCFF